jgi:transposase-like protein
MPKLKGVAFETAIIERYRRGKAQWKKPDRECTCWRIRPPSGRYHRSLVGTKVSAGTVSYLNKKVYVILKHGAIDRCKANYPYVYMDGIYLKRNWGGEYENVAILIAMAVNEEGYREVIGAAEGMKEDRQLLDFLRSLKQRGWKEHNYHR